MEVGRFHTDAEAQEKEHKEHERDHIEDIFRQEECGYTDHDARAYERDDKGKEDRTADVQHQKVGISEPFVQGKSRQLQARKPPIPRRRKEGKYGDHAHNNE